MPTPLEQSVIKTLAWFSMFHYPMSRYEVWKWMIEPDRTFNLAEVYRILDESEWLESKLQRLHGLVALKGTLKIQDQVQDRQARFLDAVRKYRSLRRAAYYFQLLPGVRAVAAVNTLAWWHTTSESDIDLYIITKPGYIWSTRLLLVAPFALLGRRPHEGAKDPFCFSFFATRDALPLESLKLERDYYLAFWCKTLVPIFDRDDALKQFGQENRWAQTVLPHALNRRGHAYHAPRSSMSIPIQARVLDPLFRSFQRSRLPSKLKELANVDSRVVVTDQMLKFHENDRRVEYRDTFESIVSRHI